MGASTGGIINDTELRLDYAPPVSLSWQDAETELVEGTPNVVAATGAGAAPVSEFVTNSEVNGFALDDNDEVYFRVPISKLAMFDLTQDLQARVIVGKESGDTDTGASFSLNARGFAAGQPNADALTSPDATITWSGLGTVGSGINATEWRNLGAKNLFAGDLYMTFVVRLEDPGSASAAELHLLNLEIRGNFRLSPTDGSPTKVVSQG